METRGRKGEEREGGGDEGEGTSRRERGGGDEGKGTRGREEEKGRREKGGGREEGGGRKRLLEGREIICYSDNIPINTYLIKPSF